MCIYILCSCRHYALCKATVHSSYTRGLNKGSSTPRMSVVVLQRSANYCLISSYFLWKKKNYDIIIKHKNTQLQGYSTQIFKIVIIYLPWCHPKLVCISFFWGTSKKIFCRTLGVKQCWSPLTFTVWTVKNKQQQKAKTFLKLCSFMFHRRFLFFYLNFWVNYSFKFTTTKYN